MTIPTLSNVPTGGSAILVTGCAGFIGFHVCSRLLNDGQTVLGVDNLSSYYDVNLKRSRLELLERSAGFSFSKIDIADRNAIRDLFENHKFKAVIHLAAQPGVRYSIENPAAYVDSNLVGFANILEGCRHSHVLHLVFASSSSVYGANERVPFSLHDNVDHPISLYAATKKANELMAHTYAHLFGLPCTGLRFFTVYGPWGRPDMAIFQFTKAMVNGEAIHIFNNGNMRRDFTYIDDIVEGVIRVLRKPPSVDVMWDSLRPNPATSRAPYRLYNIGNSSPVDLMSLIRVLEDALGKPAKLQFMPLQPGDVVETFADVSDLQADVGFRPTTPIQDGVRKFVAWFTGYYGLQTRAESAGDQESASPIPNSNHRYARTA